MTIDPARTKPLQELRHNSPLFACRFDPTGDYVYAAAQDNTIQRWELEEPALKTAFVGHRSWTRGLAFHAASRKLLSADYSGKVLVWSCDAETPTPEHTLDAHHGWVRALAVSPDGRLFATCGNDRLIKIWSCADYRLVHTLEGHDSHVYNVAFHPGGEFLVSADLRAVVKVWCLDDGRETQMMNATDILFRHDNTFRADHGGVRSLAFNADGSLLACAGIANVTNAFAGIGNPAVVLFDFATGERRQVLRPRADFRGTAWGVDFADRELIVGVGGGEGGALWFWQADQAQAVHTIPLPNNARDVHVHPDGRRVAVALFDGTVRVYVMENAPAS